MLSPMLCFSKKHTFNSFCNLTFQFVESAESLRGLLSKSYLSIDDIECALLPVVNSSLSPKQSSLHAQLLSMFLVHTAGDYDIYEYVLKKV